MTKGAARVTVWAASAIGTPWTTLNTRDAQHTSNGSQSYKLYPRERLQGTEIQCSFTDARPVLSAPKATTQSELRGSRVSCLGPRPSHTPARRQLVARRPPARDPSNLHLRHTPLPAALLFEMPDTSTFAFHRNTVHLTSPSSDKPPNIPAAIDY